MSESSYNVRVFGHNGKRLLAPCWKWLGYRRVSAATAAVFFVVPQDAAGLMDGAGNVFAGDPRNIYTDEDAAVLWHPRQLAFTRDKPLWLSMWLAECSDLIPEEAPCWQGADYPWARTILQTTAERP